MNIFLYSQPVSEDNFYRIVARYIIGGHEINLTFCHPAIENWKTTGAELTPAPAIFHVQPRILCRSKGWVAGKSRMVEVYAADKGFILSAEGFRDFFISEGGTYILPVEKPFTADGLEREVVLGPGLVLALAMNKKWCLHCGGMIREDHAILFLGESGFGKSTLVKYLLNEETYGMRAADDILPVSMIEKRVVGWPRFPQLKLEEDPQRSQLPAQVPIRTIIVLEPRETGSPMLQLMNTEETMKNLLAHTAGARLFPEDLLAEHFKFCGEAAKAVSAYRLIYPHQRDQLPKVKSILDALDG